MKNLFFLFILFSALACSTDAEEKTGKEVFIFNNISFKLLDGEYLTPLNPGVKEAYLSNFQPSHLQVPLFKSIENTTYSIYLGLPFNTTIEKLVHYELVADSVAPLLTKSDTLTYFFKQHFNDTLYISEYAQVFDGNLIYLLATTKSEAISDSLFNQTALSDRFNEKTK